jgi:hypothetical protein
MEKIKGIKLVIPPKYQSKDFDSDCLCIENHLACWVYNQKRGYCPFLDDRGPIFIKEKQI